MRSGRLLAKDFKSRIRDARSRSVGIGRGHRR